MRDDRPMERTAGMVTGLVAVKRARASLPGQDLPRAAESAFRGRVPPLLQGGHRPIYRKVPPECAPSGRRDRLATRSRNPRRPRPTEAGLCHCHSYRSRQMAHRGKGIQRQEHAETIASGSHGVPSALDGPSRRLWAAARRIPHTECKRVAGMDDADIAAVFHIEDVHPAVLV